VYLENEKCIPFDAGLLHKIKRQILIRIHYDNIIYTFESDLDALKKIADGHRHRVKNLHYCIFFLTQLFISRQFFFTPQAQAEMAIKYKGKLFE
jgi:hypothetical protein